MHNAMYPGSAKFQTRPASPQFANFSPPADYPHLGNTAAAAAAAAANAAAAAQATAHHHASMSMRHPKTMASKGRTAAAAAAGAHHMLGSNTMGMMSGGGGGGGSIGHHRGDLIFPDDIDSIEFCMPPPPAPANGIGLGHGHGHGVNGDLLLLQQQQQQQQHSSNGNGNGFGSAAGEAFTERRRRGHSRRSNHKMDVEQQVKWSRKNIAATMERFEPTTHSSSSTSSLEYGFAAGVVTPATTPSHPSQMSPVQHAGNGGGGGGGGGASLASGVGGVGGGGGGAVNHVYSYAYYEPGAAKCHTNIPHRDGPTPPIIPAPLVLPGPSKSPPRNSIRALLAKSFRSKSNSGASTSSSPSTDDRHTYTTRYGTTENLYEEVNDQKIRKVLSDNRIATSGAGNVKEELRRVQHNHFRVLDELNLSLEALIMPPTPPDISPNHGDDDDDDDGPTTSAAAAAASVAMASNNAPQSGGMTSAQRPRRGGLLGGAASASSAAHQQQQQLSHASLENLSSTLNSMELKEHAHSACINPEFDEGDLDSGFSGSGSSSGASYNESLRYYKTTGTSHQHPHQHPHQHQLHQQQQQHLHHHQQSQPHTTTLPHNLRSCRSSTASGTSTSKSSMASSEDQGIGMGLGHGAMANGMAASSVGLVSPFNYARRCSDTQHRASGRSVGANAVAVTGVGAVAVAATQSSATGTKPKKNFWTIKP